MAAVLPLSAPAPPRYRMLSELLENPELLEPPRSIIPHFLWEGRVSLLAAEEKSGKSTITGQAAAAVSTAGYFMGMLLDPSPVVWLALDEPVADLVRRLARFGAREHVAIADERPTLDELDTILEETGARVVVIDTLTEYAVGSVENFDKPEAWAPLLKGLRQLAQARACGIMLLHHTNRTNGRYANSRQIGAGVDAILEMTADPTDPAVRTIRSRGRVVMETLALRYSDLYGYQFEGAEMTLEEKVLAAVTSYPGKGITYLRKVVGGRAAAVDEAVARLEKSGAIWNEGAGGAKAYVLGDGWPPEGTGCGTGSM